MLKKVLKKLSWLSVLLLLSLNLSGCASLKGSNKTEESYDPNLNPYNAHELLTMGEKASAGGHQKEAIKYYKTLNIRFPFSPYTRQAELNSIYAYFQEKQYADAIASADRYIRVYPRGPHIDYAYYIRGLINMERGRGWLYRKLHVDPAERDLAFIHAAFLDFTRTTQLFPNSDYTPDAHQRLLYLRNLLARHELRVAEYYYSRRAYIGAANRAAYIVAHYEGSPQVEGALSMMVRAYRKIGETELAENALKVLRLNYPNHGPVLQKEKKGWLW